MDPNATLADIREAIAAAPASLDVDTYAEYAAMIMSRFQALDAWLSRGGFLPADWQRD